MGAGKDDLFRQFLTYNLLVGAISMAGGILLTLLLRPAIEDLGGNFIFQNLKLFSVSLVLVAVLILLSSLFTSMISTSRLYRHLQINFLSSRQGPPADATGRNLFIRAVIILEYIITFILVSNLTLIAKQTSFAKEQQLGATHPNAIHIPDLHRTIVDQFPLFKEKMMESPQIAMVTASMEEPTGQAMDANTFEIDGVDEGDKQLFLFPVDEDFFRFYNLRMVSGSNLPEFYNPDDSAEFFVLNESAARMISGDLETLLGAELNLHFNYPCFIADI